MNNNLSKYIIKEDTYIIDVLNAININKEGFLIVVDDECKVLGTITDGDIRRALLNNIKLDESIISIYQKNFKYVFVNEGIIKATKMMKNESIKFIPIVDDNKKLINILTKKQIQSLLLKDIHADLTYDFFSLDENLVDYEIFHRPWGFYKTTVLNDFYQGKVISVKPGQQLSLQSHNHREEHWIIVHGNGIVQIAESKINVQSGRYVFIPKGAKHRLTNTDKSENLILTEVQIGDYLGEDDIIRYEDNYGRA